MQTLTRLRGWQGLLNQHLTASQRLYAETGEVWGSFDCCIFAFDWVRLATGVDPMADYRGCYASKEEAMTLLRSNGDGTLEGALRNFFGDPVHAAISGRGDIAFRKQEKAVGLVITSGARQAAVFLGDERRFALTPIASVDMAFKVGS